MKKVFMGIAMAAAIVMFAPSKNVSAQTLYGGIGRGSELNPGFLITIDQTNGAGTLIARPGTIPGLAGLAFDATGTLYGTTINGGPPFGKSNLIRIDPDTGALLSSVPITLNGVQIAINDLAVQPGTDVLFGTITLVDDTQLATLNKVTGVATLLGNIGNLGGAIAFTPGGTLYETSLTLGDDGQGFLNTISPVTGQVFTTVLTPDGFYSGLTVRSDGILFASTGGEGQIDILNTDGTTTPLGNTEVGGVGDLDFRPVAGGGFNFCLQDDSNGNILQFDSTTGAYMFTNCGGLVVSGFGSLTIRGSDITLQHNIPDRRVLVKVSGQAKRGTASIQLLPNGTVFTITDRDTTNNSCTCNGGKT